MPEREINFWGWGYQDKEPTDDDRENLKQLIEGILGFPERPLLDIPEIEDIEIPEPDLKPQPDIEQFSYIDKETRARHTYGKAYRDLVRGFHGEYRDAPDIVAKPRNKSEISMVLEWAAANNIAVIPFGGGSSVVGGVEPDIKGDYRGVLSLDLKNMDRVLEVDEESWSAHIQGGALGPVLQEQLNDEGFQLRHYPQSYEFSTLGGWIATRSGGHFATRYTHIDDFVESVGVVSPGAEVETRRLPGSGAGPDPNRLFIGSEGVLGVITDAWIRVQPEPEFRSKASVLFDDYWDAVEATREIVQNRLYPSNCRLLDFESTHHPVSDRLDRAVSICRDYNGEVSSKDGGDESESWRDQFFEAPYMFNSLVSMGVLVDTFETAVTWSGFRDLHLDLKNEVEGVLNDVCGDGVVSSRFTHVYPDGPASYYTVIAPTEPGKELEHWRKMKETASDILMKHNATITHHHAVGRVHRPWYEEEVPGEIRDAFWAVKNVFDPDGIMNPGALLKER